MKLFFILFFLCIFLVGCAPERYMVEDYNRYLEFSAKVDEAVNSGEIKYIEGEKMKLDAHNQYMKIEQTEKQRRATIASGILAAQS